MPNKGTVNNPTGKGFKPNKKGERRGGRQTGTLNTVTSDLKDDLLTAAEELGFPKVMPRCSDSKVAWALGQSTSVITGILNLDASRIRRSDLR